MKLLKADDLKFLELWQNKAEGGITEAEFLAEVNKLDNKEFYIRIYNFYSAK